MSTKTTFGPRVDVGGDRDRGVCGVTGDEEGHEGEQDEVTSEPSFTKVSFLYRINTV